MDYRTIFDMWRNRAFTTNEELKEKVIWYFTDWIEKHKSYHNWEPYEDKVFTITWLSLYLWFADRHSFYDYVKRGEKEEATEEEKEISHTLKKARHFIENNYERILQNWNTTWAIFALKNFGWKDTQTIEWELNDNGKWKMIGEYGEATHANLDENWDPIKE